ncbi:MAG: arabinofuranosidase catalytic domain-containing protein [Acidobacteriaceae bacterium]
MRIRFAMLMGLALTVGGATMLMAQPMGQGQAKAAVRPQGPCDIYAAAGDPCVAAHSTTRALYAGYDGPLYQVTRASDGKTLNIGVVEPHGADAGGYADAAAQDAFCRNTVCWITRIYDQSPKHNDLTQAPRGGWSGPALGGMDNVPVATMAPVMVMGHKVYGVFIAPGMGMRNDDPKGTAVDDQAEGQYWLVNGQHFNAGCCFDYGNAEIDSRDDDAGTMEATYFGDAPWWYGGHLPGPWVMTDQENNLVGCVNPDGSKLCVKLPNVYWRFVTATANGEPHHWESMGGDAQQGRLRVMFSGPRVNEQYDPMRKQGAILLGNGGDNSNGSQGTFYEGAMTAAGTFPTEATEQKVQANIVAAGYGVLPLSVAPAGETTMPPGLQTFAPGATGETTVTFANTTGAPAKDVKLSLAVPAGWRAVVAGTDESAKTFASVPAGRRVSATFAVTAGPKEWNGDVVGHAWWMDAAHGAKKSLTLAEAVRDVPAVKINEFRIGTAGPKNATNSFIELYNAGKSSVDVSGWTVTAHVARQAEFSRVRIRAGTRIAAHGFYLLGLSDSGLAAEARAGAKTIFVRDTTGMKAGDTVQIGTGAQAETRKIASVGTAASVRTTVWQSLPDAAVITIPAGSTNVPVRSVAGFKVGEKIALGYGAGHPSVPMGLERYEVRTVTAVGKEGTQSRLAAAAMKGSRNIKVMSVENISVGDTIRLDIDSVGHGIETIKVTKVGTAATRSWLKEDAAAGATTIAVVNPKGFVAGDSMAVGTAPHFETVKITDVDGRRVEFKPALEHAYAKRQEVVDVGTGLELAAPLKFNHSSNLPFADRGTGITFAPATDVALTSDNPVQALGTGIELESALAKSHGVDAVVRDASVTTAGYQGEPVPNEWFGGPTLTNQSRVFGRLVRVSEGSIALRTANGLVVDSLNYGGVTDPWLAEGYQGKSGMSASGCYVATPGMASGAGVSAARMPDGYDTDSNCTDFVTPKVTDMEAASASGATNIKVASVDGLREGQVVRIGSGAAMETATIATVGTAGATTVKTSTDAGATVIPVADAQGFRPGDTITIGGGAELETALVARVEGRRMPRIVVTAPLKDAHDAGTEVVGSGLTLAAPLARAHAIGTEVVGGTATPDAANRAD